MSALYALYPSPLWRFLERVQVVEQLPTLIFGFSGLYKVASQRRLAWASSPLVATAAERAAGRRGIHARMQ